MKEVATMSRQESMKSANLEQDLSSLEAFRCLLELPLGRSDYSVRMIAKLVELQSPKDSISIRTIQRAIAGLKDLEDLQVQDLLNPTYKANTPYYGRLAAELILIHLKFTIKK